MTSQRLLNLLTALLTPLITPVNRYEAAVLGLEAGEICTVGGVSVVVVTTWLRTQVNGAHYSPAF